MTVVQYAHHNNIPFMHTKQSTFADFQQFLPGVGFLVGCLSSRTWSLVDMDTKDGLSASRVQRLTPINRVSNDQ
jgi:hypothetical protein